MQGVTGVPTPSSKVHFWTLTLPHLHTILWASEQLVMPMTEEKTGPERSQRNRARSGSWQIRLGIHYVCTHELTVRFPSELSDLYMLFGLWVQSSEKKGGPKNPWRFLDPGPGPPRSSKLGWGAWWLAGGHHRQRQELQTQRSPVGNGTLDTDWPGHRLELAVREMILEVRQIQITWALKQLTHSFPLQGKQHHDPPLVLWHLAEMERNISQMGNQTTTRKDKDLPPDLEGTKAWCCTHGPCKWSQTGPVYSAVTRVVLCGS